ncbi:hypothetical protein ACTXT7_001071 [Hymenolepis weldensis]
MDTSSSISLIVYRCNLAHALMDADVSKLKGIGELNKALLDLEEYENTLAKSVNKYEEKRTELDKKLCKLQESLPKMSVLSTEAIRLSQIVGNAADIGIQLSGKVRQLDVAKNRVQNVEALVGNIITLCDCLNNTQSALKANDIIEAAKNISFYLNMDNRTIQLVETLEKENVGLQVLPQLQELHHEVVSKVESSFENFVVTDDAKSIEELFNIFPVIHEHDMGLSRYGTYLASKISEKAANHLALAATGDSFNKPNVHVDLMTQLLELVAQAIQANETVIQQSYGSNSLLKFIQIIQGQCDHHAELIFFSFKEKRDLEVLLQRARHELLVNNRSSISATSNGQNKEKPLCEYCLSTESVISDMVVFNARIELYLNFLRRRLLPHSRGQVDELPNTMQENGKDHEVSSEIRKFFNQCGLAKISQEVVDAYLPLEQLFLREMVNKAILMDELDENTKTFRLVDDIFFVVKKCLSRAISSGSADAVCAMFNYTNAVLSDQLIEETQTVRTKSVASSGWIQQAYHLVHKRAGSGTLATGLLGTTSTENATNGSSNGSQVDSQTQYLYVLNSVEACLNCLAILRKTLEQYIEEIYGLRRNSDLNKLQACLSDLIESLTQAFQALLDGRFEKLRSVIRPQVSSLTQSFNSVKRDLTEEEFEQYAVNDPWVESLIVGLQGLLKSFHTTLSPGNFGKFLSLLADEVLLRLERFVQQKSYNRYGALQFDKELRCIFNFFSSLSAFPCREKFARILQISKLLNLEKELEL